jgi:hypothetical protein
MKSKLSLLVGLVPSLTRLEHTRNIEKRRASSDDDGSAGAHISGSRAIRADGS